MPPGFRPQNLNDVFFAAANQVRQKPEQLTHNQKVCPDFMTIYNCRSCRYVTYFEIQIVSFTGSTVV
jgi:hypothetical protein